MRVPRIIVQWAAIPMRTGAAGLYIGAMVLRCTFALAVAIVLSAFAMLVEGQETNANSTGTILYVNHAAMGANDGSSWPDAFVDLQDALVLAQTGDQIWVAKGTYAPSLDTKPPSFLLVSGVGMYGGFAGSESVLEDRDWEKNETTLSGNSATTVLIGQNLSGGTRIDGFFIRHGWDDVSGGALQLDNSTLEIVNCTVANNSAGWTGGAIMATQSTMMLSHTHFTSNHGVLHGGAIHLEDGALTMSECNFAGNTVSQCCGFGGAISASDSPITAVHCSFSNNTAGDGGAIRAFGAALDLAHCSFVDNHAIAASAILLANGALVIEDCVFQGNTGDGHIVASWDGTDLIIERSHFEGNRAAVSMSGPSSVVAIRDTDFVDNADDFLGSGGGIRIMAAASVEIDNCLFDNNFAMITGGGMVIHAEEAIIRNTRIINNTAQTSVGGGILSSGNLTIINSEISGNNCSQFTADASGGIALNGGSLTLINTLVSDNFPGGVTVGRSNTVATAEIVNSTITDNPLFFLDQHAGLRVHPDSHATVLNSIVWGNGIGSGSCEGNCGSFGAGCWCNELCCEFQDCCLDFADHCDLCEPGDQSEVLEAQQIRGPADVMYTTVQGLSPGSTFDIPGANNLGDDPLFIDPANGDFRLQTGSPAIDAGNNDFVPEGITTDLDGNPRIVCGNEPSGESTLTFAPEQHDSWIPAFAGMTSNGTVDIDCPPIVDMGAYEFQPMEVEEPCAFADLNCDGVVNHLDLVILVHSFGPCADPAHCPADLNGDGVVNAKDLLMLLGEMTPPQATPGGPHH